MIAPIQQSGPRPPAVRRAYRLVAATLLSRRKEEADCGPRVPAWKAWLFAAWVVAATAVYVIYMVR